MCSVSATIALFQFTRWERPASAGKISYRYVEHPIVSIHEVELTHLGFLAVPRAEPVPAGFDSRHGSDSPRPTETLEASYTPFQFTRQLVPASADDAHSPPGFCHVGVSIREAVTRNSANGLGILPGSRIQVSIREGRDATQT